MTDLRALLNAATPGPWKTGPDQPLMPNVGLWTADGQHHVLTSINVPVEDNAALIVAAVNALPALLDVVDAAKALRDAEVCVEGDPDAYWMQALALREALERLETA